MRIHYSGDGLDCSATAIGIPIAVGSQLISRIREEGDEALNAPLAQLDRAADFGSAGW